MMFNPSSTTRGMLKFVGRSTAAVVGTGSAYTAYKYNTDEGSRRALQAYWYFVPVILHYRWLEAQSTYLGLTVTQNDWDTLDEQYATSTVERMGQLQGMYCKYGQTASGFTNTLGDAWIVELRKLEDQVPPRPLTTVLKTIEEETGKPASETFDYVDPTPLGSASIGQVHRAILKRNNNNNNNKKNKNKNDPNQNQQQQHDNDDGHEVAIKVQYPEAQHLFHDDIRTIRQLCEVLAPEQVVMLNALEEQNESELDYRREALNLETVSRNMTNHGFQPNEVVVPRPYHDLTTSRMLVMDLIPGPKLIDGIRAYYHIWAQQNGTTLHALEQESRRKIEEHGIPSKYDGPSSSQVSLYRTFLRCRDVVQNTGIFLYNWTVGSTITQPFNYQHTVLPPNTPRIVDCLMRVHGYQLLADGFFNSDPNGGNFIYCNDDDDRQQRIGLIDYGAVKQLTRKERLSACLLYAALARKDERMLFDMCDVGGYRSKYGDRDVLMKLLLFGYDSWGQDVLEGKNIQSFIDELKRKDPWTQVPDNLVMAQFMSIRLRSLALGMNHPVRCSDYWGPIAEEMLRREGHPYETWDHDKLVEYMPEMNMQKMSWYT